MPTGHRAGQADPGHPRAGGDDGGVLQDRQHRGQLPQPRLDDVDHLVDLLGAAQRRIDPRLNAAVTDPGGLLGACTNSPVLLGGAGLGPGTVVVAVVVVSEVVAGAVVVVGLGAGDGSVLERGIVVVTVTLGAGVTVETAVASSAGQP
jgi:hypothetical protein